MPYAILGAGAFSKGKTNKKTLHPLIHDPGPGVPQHAGLRGEKPPQSPHSRLSHFRPNCGTHSAFLGPIALSTDSRFLLGPPTPGFGFFPSQRSGIGDSASLQVLPDTGFFHPPPRPASGWLPLPFSLFPQPGFQFLPRLGLWFNPGLHLALRRLKGRPWQPSFAQEERPAHPVTPRTFPGVARTLLPLPSRLRSKTGTVSVLDYVSHRPQGHE